MDWTEEQKLAIYKSGMNIIVSAGAGSGKTAVLTERVIQKLLNGEDINNLLILTFTSAAAKEMKDRIRKAIKKAGLKEQLLRIDSSFITTFDSFALSIVKKYHYLLNIDSNVEIANDLILKFKKRELLDEIFISLYDEENKDFLKLISDFTTRDDSKIKNSIIEMFDKIDLKYDAFEYLDNYINNYYDEEFINLNINNYLDIIKNKIGEIENLLQELELIVDGDFYEDFVNALNNLFNSKTYDDIKNSLDIKLPRLKKGMDDVKPCKEKISNKIKEIDKLAIYDNYEELKMAIIETKQYVLVIINILKELMIRFNNYKSNNNLYDFLDIAKLAIKIVKEYDDARNELQESFHEILVDEYQDTSDLQEMLINLISNHNVYMVGDIKQSIYRFRNANPNLFKAKYLNYEKNNGGFKIDLVNNFRSREEVLANINYIFDLIMDIEIGGADYKKSHRMVFGNTSYNINKASSQDYNFELYNYDYQDKDYSNSEIEAFIVLDDIKKKISNKYQVFDKNIKSLRNITYDDFVILIDKSTDFELYKKIFEANGVTLTIVKDENISGSNDLLILNNILKLIKCFYEKNFDKEFWYSYLSVARSYLFNLNDDYLYHKIINHDLNDDEILLKIKDLLQEIENINTTKLIREIILKFNFYENLIKVSNIEESIIRLEYLESLVASLSKLSYTFLDVIAYFNKMIEQNEKITYSLNKDVSNSVKIMTIHKSKGLEYPICYYTGLTSKFNTMDMKKRFLYDNYYGIITPYINNGVKNTIYQLLSKNINMKEDISERIRLFYVGLTRAREKMIIVTNLKTEENDVEDFVSLDTRLKYNSFASILNSIKGNILDYIKEVDLSKINLSKEYTMIKETNIKNLIPQTDKIIKVEELKEQDNLEIKEKKYSKNNISLLDEENYKKLELGTKIHSYLEYLDFKNPDYSLINNEYKEYIQGFINCNLLSNIKDSLNIYKEYEFISNDKEFSYHGIIDLMIEYDNYIDIIDYKLKNIYDTEYLKQLKGYSNYISLKTNKKINIYLYSIIDKNYIRLDN